jgi:hypothetical protein
MTITQALTLSAYVMLRQEDLEFKASLGKIVRVQGQPGLHTETLSQNKIKQKDLLDYILKYHTDYCVSL